MMERIKFRFFGRFQANRDEQKIKLTSSRIQAFLAWLILQPDQTASRETIAAILWPETETQRAQQNLRKTLSRLRKSLGDVIVGTRWDVSLAQKRWESDLADFQTAIENGELNRAVALYDGDLLNNVSTGSFAMDEWLLLQRESCRRDYLNALRQLTESAFDSADYEAALNYSRLKIATDQFDEPTYCDAMEALALLNRQREATALFEQLRELFSAELNIVPATETVALHQQIISGDYGKRTPRTAQAAAPPPSNLPRLHSKFIGRTELKSRAESQLSDANCNLLTLVGIGGVGKTRFSLAIAESLLAQFPDGVWFVPLERLDSELGIIDSVAAAVGIEISSRMFDEGERLAHVVNQLKDRQLLLLLDNYESVIDHVALVQALLADAPGVKILVTSRERLRLQSEWVIQLDGLAFPTEVEDGNSRSFPAVQLFEVAALRHGADIDLANPSTQHALASITRDVGGIPLAIELAAAWSTTFSAETIADRITTSIDILTTQMRDATPRHRSIRAVFEQTLAMLSAEEKSLFERMVTFVGGFDLPAAKNILAVDEAMLEGLQARALLNFDGSRYSMHPMIRQFAVEQWEQISTETQHQVSHSHAIWYADWLTTFTDIHMPANRQTMQPDIDNVRAAWRWASDNVDLELLNRLRLNLFTYSDFSGAHHELFESFNATQEKLDSVAQPTSETLQTRAWILLDIAEVSYKFTRFKEAINQVKEVEQIGLLTEDARLLVRAYARKIGCKNMLGQRDEVAELGQKALAAVSADDEAGLALIHGQLSTSAEFDGNGELALEHSQKEVEILRRIDDPIRLAVALNYLGIGYARTGQPDKRVELSQEAYKILRDAEIIYEATGTGINLAVGITESGDFKSAAKLYEELIVSARKINEQRMIAVILWNMADVYLCTRKYDRGLQSAYEALAVYAATEDKFGALGTQETLALLHSRMGDFEAAQMPFSVAIEGYEQAGYAVSLFAVHHRIGNAAFAVGDLEAAQKHAAIAEELRNSSDSPVHSISRCLLLGRIAFATENYTDALAHFRCGKQEVDAVTGEDEWLDIMAGEAKTLLHIGEKAEALKVVELILPNLADESILDQTECVPAVFVACAEVLQANEDRRADQVLAAGLAFLEKVSAEISNPESRNKYLNNIVYNRRLAALNG